MNEVHKECLFCGKSATFKYLGGLSDVEQFNCPICKTYMVYHDARYNIPTIISQKYAKKRYLVSGVFRERFEFGLNEEIISTENFESMLHTFSFPATLQDKLDKVILHLYNKTKFFSERIDIYPHNDYSIGYAINVDEFNHMLMELDLQRHMINREQKHSEHYTLRLLSKGFERAEQLRTNPIISNQCFVAMWYSPEMNKIYSDYIVPAIEATTLEGQLITNEKSYKSIKIDMKDFNDEIVDEIISEIRKSKFLVAEFTGNRGGVYYEAGFAEGLGLKVIFCCKKDDFNKMHFDVNHKNYIVWETGEELYHKLRKRISATIL